MKKILIILLTLVGIFTLTGCEKNNQTNTTNNTNTNEKQNQSNIKIGNIDVELNRSSSFKKISFKYPDKGAYSNLGTYVIMDLMNNDDLLVRVAMSFYENKSIDKVYSDSKLTKTGDKKYNNYTYNIYEGKQDDGKNIINYTITYNNDTYIISFISDKNIQDFIELFMNNVIFN